MFHWDPTLQNPNARNPLPANAIYGAINDASPQSFFQRLLETDSSAEPLPQAGRGIHNVFNSASSAVHLSQLLRATFHTNIALFESLPLGLLRARYVGILR